MSWECLTQSHALAQVSLHPLSQVTVWTDGKAAPSTSQLRRPGIGMRDLSWKQQGQRCLALEVERPEGHNQP